ncbi:MAG: replicative DNA helicase [Holosporaceae bacterium]|jgi:replicative DNA helicase|nr:replicative DNA helicase [Holosporaceae bacterium]
MRVLPHNIEAEQSLLGSIMLNNEYFESVSEFLLPTHFNTPINGKIFEAVGKLISQGSAANPITLRAYFEEKDELKEVGGGSYLVQLVNSVVFMAGAVDYAKLIYDMYLRRQLILIGEGISYEAANFDINVKTSDQIESAEAKLYELSTSNRQGGFVPFSGALINAFGVIEKAYQSDKSIIGITSGFVDIDRWIGGLNRSDLIILAGRPSMGKTALATNIAVNAATASMKKTEGGGKVAFFSLEMSSEQLVTRILAQECGIPSEKIRKGEIREEDFSKLVEANKKIADLPLYIDDTPALTISAVRTRARRLQRKCGVDMIIVDYLQLLHGSDGRGNENRVLEISEVTRSLKALAKELNVPVIALSQLSRAVEARDDKRPQLSDLRESGSIEQDADVVMFVYREEYYEARREPSITDKDKHDKWVSKMADIYGLAEVIFAKQRHGPIGTVRLFFDGRYTKFDNLSERKEN